VTLQTEILPFSPDAIVAAARLIISGAPVAVPTETVYGLAADATSGNAVAAIYAAKGRPSFNPLIVHVPDVAAAERLADLSDVALRLAEKLWPGPLTIVAPLRPGSGIASLTTAGLPTVALRVPAHPAMQALLQASDRPLAAPSANASGTISPTRAGHVLRSLGGRIPLIVDAGPCAIGLESTIVAVDDLTIRLLRPGPITIGILAEISGLAVGGPSTSIEAPGQLAQHYAPSKPLRLDATTAHEGEWLIGFGPVQGDVSLSPQGDLAEAAARLFDLLHDADAGPAKGIAIAPIRAEGLGAAINDRLGRAAT
jgi:L-threonylcarbamoyladenylate synthase